MSNRSPRLPPSSYAYTVLALTVALMLSDYMTRSVMSGVLPDLKDAWTLSDTQLGLLVSIVPLVVGTFALPIALFADRFGYVRAITAMGAVWCVATVLCGFSQSNAQLLMARAAVGLGEAGYGAVGAALLSRVFPANRLSAVLGAFQSAGVFGTVLGVVVGGVIAARHGWESAFVWVGAGSLLLVALYPILVREPPRARSPMAGPMERMPLRAVAGALFSARSARYTYLASGLQMFIIAAIAGWMPTFLAREYGLAADQAGARAGLVILAIGVGMIVGGLVADRAGQAGRRKLRIASAYTLLSVVLLATAFALPAGPAQMSLLFFGSLFSGAHAGVVMTTIAAVTDAGLRATAIATVALFNNLLGLAPAPYLVGVLSDATSLKTTLTVMPAAGLAASLCFVLAAGSYARERTAIEAAPTQSAATRPPS